MSQHFQAIFGLIPDRNLAVNSPKKTINSLVVLTILKNSSQWEGLSHILWNIKNVPNLQPEYIYIYTIPGFGTGHHWPTCFLNTSKYGIIYDLVLAICCFRRSMNFRQLPEDKHTYRRGSALLPVRISQDQTGVTVP